MGEGERLMEEEAKITCTGQCWFSRLGTLFTIFPLDSLVCSCYYNRQRIPIQPPAGTNTLPPGARAGDGVWSYYYHSSSFKWKEIIHFNPFVHNNISLCLAVNWKWLTDPRLPTFKRGNKSCHEEEKEEAVNRSGKEYPRSSNALTGLKACQKSRCDEADEV